MFNVIGQELIIDQHKLADMSYIEAQAAIFAAKAHGEQLRKYSGSPYIVHPQEVASILRHYGYFNPDLLAAAWLHDVVEDTTITAGEIDLYFNANVGFIVEYVTDVSRPEDGNRRRRKALDRAHAARGSAASQILKCADILSNAPSIRINDPDFFKVWSHEKIDLLTCLTQADDVIKNDAMAILR